MSTRRSSDADSSPAPLSKGRLTVFGTLLGSSLLWTSEGAIQGEGLYLAVLWLLSLCGLLVSLARSERQSDHRTLDQLFTIRSLAGLAMVAIVVFVGSVWLSTWHVFRVAGDRRAALNLAFAWTGLGAAAIWCRVLFARVEYRLAVLRLVVGLGVGLAVFGIWQSKVFYATEAQNYLEKRQLLDSGSNPARTAQVRDEFRRSGIPFDGPGRRQFEQRLLQSSEPFGPYALANTFAGVLAVTLVLLLGHLLVAVRDKNVSRTTAIMILGACFVTGWCLILTKSRTAWLAAGIGAIFVVVRGSSWGSATATRLLLRTLVFVGIPAALFLTGGVLTGVIDREVLLESPRSFRFRLFYWEGAAGVIGESPWWGSGPGNFRQHYLQHKPVESSEAILDPHNLFLDAWCFAGLAGLTGILGLASLIIIGPGRQATTNGAALKHCSLIPSVAGATVIHFAAFWFAGKTAGTQEAVLLISLGTAAIVTQLLPRHTETPGTAAALTLLIHLQAAGGLQIPVCGLLLIVLTLATLAPPTQKHPDSPVTSRKTALFGGLIACGLALATTVWGLAPVTRSHLSASLGMQKLQFGDHKGALRSLTDAVDLDPLSADLRQQFLQAAAYDLMRTTVATGETSVLPEADWLRIQQACSDLIDSDTRRISSRQTVAEIHYRMFRRTNDHHYIDNCLASLRLAAEWYPGSASLLATLAQREADAGNIDAAISTARRAMNVEAVNREWSHTDQFLPQPDVRKMQQLIHGETNE